MSDDKNKKGAQDRARVSGNEDFEIDYLVKKHHVTRAEVEAAIKVAGNRRQDVEAYLANHKK